MWTELSGEIFHSPLTWVFAPCIFTDYNERVFVLIWFISLSSNLKLSIDIFIMSVRHVFADFRFIFVKRSCSRRDSASLYSLFYKIILYILYKVLLILWVHTNKSRPFTVTNDVLLLLLLAKITVSVVSIEKNAIDWAGASMSCALTSTLRTN